MKISRNAGRVRRRVRKTTGVLRLYEMADGTLKIPAINVNDSVTKSKSLRRRESLVDGVKRATDVMMAGKSLLFAGLAMSAKGRPKACGRKAHVMVTEVDLICASVGNMEGEELITLRKTPPRLAISLPPAMNISRWTICAR